MQRLLLLCALAAGCRSSIDDSAYLPFGGRDAATATVDASCGVVHTWRSVAVPLDEMALVDAAPRHGAAIRLRLRFHRTACGVAGPTLVTANLGDQTDFVTFTQMVWDRGGEDCVPFPDESVIVLGDLLPGLGAPVLSLRDSVGGATVGVKVAPRPAAPCASRGEGEPCLIDCECGGDPALRCIPNTQVEGLCWRPCAEDVDCGGRRCGEAPGQVPLVCGGNSPACQDSECPFGQRCRTSADGASTCQPAQDNAGHSCDCEAPCGFGGLCRDDHQCIAPCRTNRDCPGQVVCDNGACDVLP